MTEENKINLEEQLITNVKHLEKQLRKVFSEGNKEGILAYTEDEKLLQAIVGQLEIDEKVMAKKMAKAMYKGHRCFLLIIFQITRQLVKEK